MNSIITLLLTLSPCSKRSNHNPDPLDGAGLIYTSVKEEKNLDLLHKYILHKIYEFQFSSPALVVEKDAVFM